MFALLSILLCLFHQDSVEIANLHLAEQSGVLKAGALLNIAEAATTQLQQEINSLKAKKNAKLRDSLDVLEQYCRRPLVRVTGFDENDPPQSEDTVAKK